jgi:translation initiation factor 1
MSPEKQTARLSVEKRNRGKTVTVIRGLSARDNDLPELLARLKDRCGAGGSIDGDTLEIQGNHQERLRSLLGEIGYRLK